MLPSMPLISTPLKEPVPSLERSELIGVETPEVPIIPVDNLASSDGAAPKDPVCETGKSTDPGSHAEKQSLRPIAPKPVVVVISAPAPAFAAVPQISSTETLSALPETVKLPVGLESTKQPEAIHTEQSPEQQVESSVHDHKEETQTTEEGKNLESVERKDDEGELAALMLASSTIRSSPKSRSSAVKKKSKHVRDIESTLKLLAPDGDDVKNEKAFGYAQAYFMKVTERLEGKDDVLYLEFLKIMNDFGQTINSVAELYRKVTVIFHEHPDLAEEFLTFLLPEQAMECGKFMEHLMLTKMREFFRMLEVYFAKQPQQMRKIYSSLSALCTQSNVTQKDVRASILPLLKGNSLLVDSFLQLLPEERPPDSIVSEYEEMDCGDADCYHSGDDQFETVDVPDQKDMYGGDHCLCSCHETDDKSKRRAHHCVSCGTKFIYGRVFVQTGKVLRPAKVVFDVDKNSTIKRLSAKDRPKKCGRKRSVFRYNKDSTPTKSHNEDGRHDSETVSPKSSRSSKSRTPAPNHKKGPYKSVSSSKLNSSEGNKSTSKDVKASTCHSVRVVNSANIARSRVDPPFNVPVKKLPLLSKVTEKQCSSTSSKEPLSLTCKFDEMEPRVDGKNLEPSLLVRDPAFLSSSVKQCAFSSSNEPLSLTCRADDLEPGAKYEDSKPSLLVRDSVPEPLSLSCRIGHLEPRTVSKDSETSLFGNDPKEQSVSPSSKEVISSTCRTDNLEHSTDCQGSEPSFLVRDCTFLSPVSILTDQVTELSSLTHLENVSASPGIVSEEATPLSLTVCDKSASLSPTESIIPETIVPVPPAVHDECASTLPPAPSLGQIPLKDFSSLSQVIGSREPSQDVIPMDIAEEPENLSFTPVKKDICHVLVRENKLKDDICNSSSSDIIGVSESAGLQESTDKSLGMEVDSMNESKPEEENKFSPSEVVDVCHNKPLPISWTREEDKVILQMFQMECNAEQTFQKISHHLSLRTVDQIRDRFYTLMNLLERMTGVKMEQE